MKFKMFYRSMTDQLVDFERDVNDFLLMLEKDGQEVVFVTQSESCETREDWAVSICLWYRPRKGL